MTNYFSRLRENLTKLFSKTGQGSPLKYWRTGWLNCVATLLEENADRNAEIYFKNLELNH
jgi:hypothetical protein